MNGIPGDESAAAGTGMILCVNLNAAVDRTVVVDGFHLGQIHRARTTLRPLAPAGEK